MCFIVVMSRIGVTDSNYSQYRLDEWGTYLSNMSELTQGAHGGQMHVGNDNVINMHPI